MRPVLTIDLGAVVANWRALNARGPAEAAAVLKADAYGLGVDDVAPALAAAGARVFFVATAPEAAAIRPLLPNEAALYVLNGASEGLATIREAGARPVLNTLEETRAAAAEGWSAPVALQIETGMNRLGAGPEDLPAMIEAARALDVALVMSHLACADSPEDPMNAAQRAAFDAALPRFRAAFPTAQASLSATGGALMGPSFAYDLVRPGVGLYGGLPFAEARACVRLEAPLVRVWDVPVGAASGYGGGWRATRPSRLATIPVGYADGIPRALSGRGTARVADHEAPFAGRVSMDLIVLDVTDAPGAAVGARAVLLDESLTVDRMATSAATIGYEILTALGRRYQRRYTAPS